MWDRNGLALGLFVGAALVISGCANNQHSLDPDRYSQAACEAAGGAYREERQVMERMQIDTHLGWRVGETVQTSRICDFHAGEPVPERQPGVFGKLLRFIFGG